MAFYTKIFLVFAISIFLTTLPSKAYKNYPTPSQSHAPALSASTSSLSSLTTFEIPKNTPVGDVSIFVKAIMDATMSNTDEFITKVIDKRLAEPNTDIYAKDCLEKCKSVFEDAKDAMKRTEEDVKANVDVSAMSTNIDTSNECAASIYGFGEGSRYLNLTHASSG